MARAGTRDRMLMQPLLLCVARHHEAVVALHAAGAVTVVVGTMMAAVLVLVLRSSRCSMKVPMRRSIAGKVEEGRAGSEGRRC
jgi:hypothetical protein